MKIKYLLLLALLPTMGFLSSCDDDDPEIAYVATYPVSGNWTVTYKVETSPGVFEDISGGETELLVYNTAANDGKDIWIDDHNHFWNYKVKSPVNMNDLTFSAQEAVSAATTTNANVVIPYDIMVNVANGKLIRNGTRLNGQPADSIYFQISFEDDVDADDKPFATIYHVSGHRAF